MKAFAGLIRILGRGYQNIAEIRLHLQTYNTLLHHIPHDEDIMPDTMSPTMRLVHRSRRGGVEHSTFVYPPASESMGKGKKASSATALDRVVSTKQWPATSETSAGSQGLALRQRPAKPLNGVLVTQQALSRLSASTLPSLARTHHLTWSPRCL